MTKAVLLLVALYSFPIAVYGMARDESCGSVIPLNGRVTAKEKYSYPSIASIRLFERYNKEYLQRKCVGSIISKRLILTTASCFTIKTRVVEVTLGSTDGKGHKIFSKNWELHKYYNAKNQSNDLAVIKLDGEIAFDKYTNPSCLSKIPLKETHENLKLIDLNEKLLPNGSIVGLFDVAKCKGNYPHPTNDKICVLIKKATSTFKFLHGTPLLSREKRRENTVWPLVGILSSYDSASKSFLFANVLSHLDWLNEKIKSTDRFFSNGKCGVINRRTKRIIYGNEVINPNFYPWMVFLEIFVRNETKHLETHDCNGVIIHPSYIFTAAHCIPNNVEDVYIRYGSVNLNQTRSISAFSWHVHPNFNANDKSTWENDIALIEVEPDDFESNRVETICLPKRNINIDNQTMIVAGWGNSQPYDDFDFRPVLREASVVCHNCNFVSPRFCIDRSIAATSLSGFTSYGDSGAPLFLERNGVWLVVGISSGGFAKSTNLNFDPTCPMVFTRVSIHLEWIYNIIYDNDFDSDIFKESSDDSPENNEIHSSTQHSVSDELNRNIDLTNPDSKRFKHDDTK